MRKPARQTCFALFSLLCLSACLETGGTPGLNGAAGGCLANEVLLDGSCVDGALAGPGDGALLDDVSGR